MTNSSINRVMKFAFYFLIPLLINTTACADNKKKLPVDVKFNFDSITRKWFYGDNWCQTWATDDNIYTMLDDGNGWWGDSEKTKDLSGWSGSMCLQIKGDENFGAEDVKRMEGWPHSPANSPLYAYGTISVNDTLFAWLWKSERDRWYHRPIANRLLYSPDLGKSFYRWDGQLETADTFSDFDSSTFFFYKEDPVWKDDRDAYAFNWITFCQNGKNNTMAKDDYVYMYAPEQYDPTKLAVIRVHKNQILNRDKYEYFKEWNKSESIWTKNMDERGVNLQYPENRSDGEWMWASWFPDVVYNPGLDLYIMVSYGVSDEGKNFWGSWCANCLYPASIGFWYSETPYGPWKEFYYEEYFFTDRSENRTYGFKLSPKWMSDNGNKMVLIWSDAGDNHSTNYKWNQMEIKFTF
ncbi:MAG: hypothetical protein WDZ47_07715 [Bacteroidales bacterium]